MSRHSDSSVDSEKSCAQNQFGAGAGGLAASDEAAPLHVNVLGLPNLPPRTHNLEWRTGIGSNVGVSTGNDNQRSSQLVTSSPASELGSGQVSLGGRSATIGAQRGASLVQSEAPLSASEIEKAIEGDPGQQISQDLSSNESCSSQSRRFKLFSQVKDRAVSYLSRRFSGIRKGLSVDAATTQPKSRIDELNYSSDLKESSDEGDEKHGTDRVSPLSQGVESASPVIGKREEPRREDKRHAPPSETEYEEFRRVCHPNLRGTEEVYQLKYTQVKDAPNTETGQMMMPPMSVGQEEYRAHGHKLPGTRQGMSSERTVSPQEMMALEQRVDRKLQVFTESLQQILDPLLMRTAAVNDTYQQETRNGLQGSTNSTASTDPRAYRASQKMQPR